MQTIKQFIDKPVNRGQYALFILAMLVLDITFSRLFLVLHVPRVYIETGRLISFWSFPVVSVIYTIIGKVFSYKRLIDFCSKKTATIVVGFSILASVYSYYIHYVTGINNVLHTTTFRLFDIALVVYLLVLFLMKGNSQKEGSES